MGSSIDKYKTLLDKFFNKEATKEEIDMLANWMKEKDVPEEFDSYSEQLWDLTSNQSDKQTEKEMWDIIAAKTGNRKKRFYLNPMLYRIASMILLPICICMGVYITTLSKIDKERESDIFEMLVDKGQKASVILPDGTKAWINSGTRLSYNFSNNERKVSLEGEAYFEVAKNNERRFIVNCNSLNIEALGTAFNVKGYNSDETVSVALMEGKVKVFNDANAAILSPNQSLSFNKNNDVFTRAEIKDNREIDYWRRNILYFRSASLAEIAKTLERMYGVTVNFEDEELKQVPFSGSIRNSSLNNVFHIISLTYPINYDIKNDVITINKDQIKRK